MKYCGIELKGDEARIIGIESNGDGYKVLPLANDRFKIKDPSSQQEIQAFAAKLQAFLKKEQFDAIGIKGRMTKGRFAGGSTSFKMEGIIQSLAFPVSILNAATIRSKIKNMELDLTGVHEHQIEALKTVLVLHMES